MGSARPLDFGHWAAHKLEQISEYKIRHGEAVAVGIALDVIYSRRMGYLDAATAERILRLVENLGFEIHAHELQNTDSEGQLLVLRGLEEFREHLGGRLTVTLLRAIGEGFEVHDLHAPTILASIQELEQRSRQGGGTSLVTLSQR
jgi:3-dehydroquinate synthase